MKADEETELVQFFSLFFPFFVVEYEIKHEGSYRLNLNLNLIKAPKAL